jgi:hypothetical protein
LAQYDISRSLQLLIRESIQRDGYIDVVNRPVEQLPRRGRPPQADSEPGRGPSGDEGAALFDAEAQPSSPVGAALPDDSADGTPLYQAHHDTEDAPTPEAVPQTQGRAAPSGLDAFLTH